MAYSSQDREEERNSWNGRIFFRTFDETGISDKPGLISFHRNRCRFWSTLRSNPCKHTCRSESVLNSVWQMLVALKEMNLPSLPPLLNFIYLFFENADLACVMSWRKSRTLRWWITSQQEGKKKATILSPIVFSDHQSRPGHILGKMLK